MLIANTSSLLISTAVGAFIVWRIVSRIRRMVGKQTYSPVRIGITLVVFPLLLALILFAARNHIDSLLGLLAGMVLGAGLGIYGNRLTKFEHTTAGRFYTPNAHLGIALSLLLIGRLAWRFGELYFATQSFSGPPPDITRSPLTLFIFGMLATYYVSYALGLLRWSRRSQVSVINEALTPVTASAASAVAMAADPAQP